MIFVALFSGLRNSLLVAGINSVTKPTKKNMKTYTIKSRVNCNTEYYVSSLSRVLRIVRSRPENWRVSRQLSAYHQPEQMVIMTGPKGGVKIELA